MGGNDCEICNNPGEYHHRIKALEKEDADLQAAIILVHRRIDGMWKLLFGTFVSSVTATISVLILIIITFTH